MFLLWKAYINYISLILVTPLDVLTYKSNLAWCLLLEIVLLEQVALLLCLHIV